MQIEIFDAIYQQERTYWWFVCRRRLVLDFYRRYHQATSARPRVFDLGCGTGAMLDDFVPHAEVFGADVSLVALRYCRQRGLGRLLMADGTRLPWHNQSLDCIVAMDVLEHIADDQAVLREFYRVCAPGSLVLITVPALRWLWTTRDERLAHKRRYHRVELIERARAAGFQIEKCSYYCACMLPAFALLVGWERLRGRHPDIKQDVPRLPAWTNKLLQGLLTLEQFLLRYLNYPLGVSLFCVLRKPLASPDPRMADVNR